MHHANLEKLKSLRLFGMVRALQELVGLDDRGRLDFDDQLALLIERETADRANAALETRLKRARLRLRRPASRTWTRRRAAAWTRGWSAICSPAAGSPSTAT